MFTFSVQCLADKNPANSAFMLWSFILMWLLLFLGDISAPSNVIFASDFVQAKYFHQKKCSTFNSHILQDE